MAEEKQQADELDQKMEKSPESPPADISASPEKEEVKVPEMDVPQSESASGEQPETQVQDTPQEASGEESTDLVEETAEAEIMKKPEEDSVSAPDSADDTPEMEDQPFVEKPSFEQLKPKDGEKARNINMLLDVSLPVSIELGRTNMAIEDILCLGPGSVIELDKLAGEPVDLLVNDKLLARGEVVVVDENFGLRVTSMISPQDRIRSLK